MKLVYLKTGQQAYLKEQIGDRFIVNRINVYIDYYGDQEREVEIEGEDEIVNEVFKNPPKEKIDAEIIELKAKKKAIEEEIKTLQNSKSKLNIEVSQITKTKVDSEKFIINRSDILKAKELVLFPKDTVMPIIRKSEDKSMRGLKVAFDISISTGEERAWGYKLYYDYNDTYSQYLCEKYGILIDPTQEEIDEVIIKRLNELTFSDYNISLVPDDYLSEKLLDIKKNYLEDKRIKDKTLKEAQIEKLKKEIEKLQEQ
jgi:hypothetical protein